LHAGTSQPAQGLLKKLQFVSSGMDYWNVGILENQYYLTTFSGLIFFTLFSWRPPSKDEFKNAYGDFVCLCL
jgi:hypothetical protein